MASHPLLKYWMLPLLGMLLLLVSAGFLVQQQFHIQLQEDQANTEREMHLLASLVQLHLQEGNYQYVEETLKKFGYTDPNLATIKLTATSGFVIASYQRHSSSQFPHHLEMTINYSYRGNATLILERDMVEVYHQRSLLIAQLLGALLVMGALLGFLFYAIVLRQREARLLLKKTHELDQANQALSNENMQRRKAEEALFEEKEHAEVTLHSIGDAVITTDATGKVTQLNPVAQQLTGWTIKDAVDQPLQNVFCIINSQTRQPVANPVEQVLATGQIIGLANHTTLIARDGTEHHIADSAAPILNRDGQITGVVLVFHDISKQYLQQAAIASREAELRKITRILPGPVTRVDADGRYAFVSDVFETWFGKRPEDVIGLKQAEIIGPELYKQYEPYFKCASTGETTSFEVSLPDSSNSIRHALVKVVPDFTED
ncbi:MAG: PAS domain-containing protein, partial [Gammaproteobacteria bacterium]